MKNRAFCFTWNNYTDESIAKLAAIDCKYVVYGKETAPSTGTPHLQGYIVFPTPRSHSSVCKKLFGARVFVAKGSAGANFDYVSKEGSLVERGTRPEDPFKQGETERDRWALARAAAVDGRYSDIPDDLYTRYQNSFKRMRREDGPRPVDLPPTEFYGLWIYGPSGTGKSYMARTEYAPVYLKDINKWWDDYQGEDNVLIDEFSPTAAPFMVQFLKRWADRWTFSAETKGAKIIARPKLIIVTSNYSMDECFSAFPVDLPALQRRFRVIHLTTKYKWPSEAGHRCEERSDDASRPVFIVPDASPAPRPL